MDPLCRRKFSTTYTGYDHPHLYMYDLHVGHSIVYTYDILAIIYPSPPIALPLLLPGPVG